MNKLIISAAILTLINLAVADSNSPFDPSKKIDGIDLILNGTGIRKATFLGIKVYKAGLYLKTKSNNPSDIISGELPKYLELHFMRNVEAEKIRQAWSESIKNNNENFAAISSKVEALNKAMKDIKEGDQLSFTFLKNNSTKISLAGSEVTVIEGADFQIALLRVWMGPRPPNEELKDGLLSIQK